MLLVTFIIVSRCLWDIACMSVRHCVYVCESLRVCLWDIACMSVSHCVYVCETLRVCLWDIACMSVRHCVCVWETLRVCLRDIACMSEISEHCQKGRNQRQHFWKVLGYLHPSSLVSNTGVNCVFCALLTNKWYKHFLCVTKTSSS
jgi:hypothetical protein